MTATLIKALEEAKDTATVGNLVASFVNDLGMRYYAYWAVNVPGSPRSHPLAMNNYPYEWMTEYLEKNYVFIDPVAVKASSHLTPFPWGTDTYLAALTKKEMPVFEDARKYGVRYGILSPFHAAGHEFSAISMASHEDETEESFHKEYDRRAFAIGAVTSHVHSAIRRILNVELAVNKGLVLSPREVEVLSWIAHGKSYADIGEILAISRHTVITHANRAKKKLDVSTVQQAVHLMLSSGLGIHEIVGTNI